MEKQIMTDKKRQNKISHALSTLLRHTAQKKGLPISVDGYIPISLVLQQQPFKSLNTTLEEIEEVCRTNDKQRFSINDGNIRANQGHTIRLENPDLEEITLDNLDQYPIVLHGTYFSSWEKIKHGNALKRMNRTHIHMAQGLFGQVKSGVRKDIEVIIYIDLPKAINDGLKFYKSSNDVVLCQGPISVIYFKHVLTKDLEPFDPDFPTKLE